MSAVRVSDVERAISTRFPLVRAEEWDRCGLLAGDPDADVTGVALALDPSLEAIEYAVSIGANVLVTHHPAFLTPPQWLTPARGSAGVVFSAVSRGVALINAHTNLDRDREAQRLLPLSLGLEPIKPLERTLQPMSLVTVFVPHDAADKIVDAMTGAGAGRVGDYRRCSFGAQGTGSYIAPEAGSPALGAAGERSSVAELRVEMVCPTLSVRGVVSAAIAVHPYEEPLVLVEQADIARNSARLGMLSAAPEPLSLDRLAHRAGEAHNATPRVWGDPDAAVERVATATGSAGSLVGAAIASGAHVLVAGEVRYHDALEAVGAGLSVIELGHDVTEWPLVGLLEQTVRMVPGLDASAVNAMDARRGWWTPNEGRGAT